VFPAYEGTLSSSNRKGDRAELAAEGKAILWFSKLGDDCGRASVSIDGADPEIVDTYSADDIFGVCVYRKSLMPGKHTVRITVLNERGKHPSANPDKLNEARVHIDGFRIER
jgi:hypothetical protein